MTKPGTIEFRDVPKPVPKDSEVLVEIKRIGVCGSDIHVYHGLHPYTSYPVVQGHEVSGKVVAKGRNVSQVSIGDNVTFLPQVTCGTCYPCTHGMYHICNSLKVMGFQTSGAAQEYFPVQEELIVRVPNHVSFDAAAMIEPVAVAVHALRRGGDVTGKQILVLGAGPIGNLVGQVAKGLGAAKVMITDVSDFRIDMAKQCGLDYPVNTAKEDLANTIDAKFGESKADLILECAGAQPAISQALSTARKGTTIVVVGVFSKKPEVDLALVQDRELSIVGTLMYQRKDYETAIRLLAEGRLILEKLITTRFTFADYQKAYEYIEKTKDRVMKVMITME